MTDIKELEKVFENFLINNVGTINPKDTKEVLDMEKQLNINIPLSLKKLLNILAKESDINFPEWSLKNPSEIFLSRKLDLGKNLFEQLIEKDQKSKSSSTIIEILTNSIFLGYMENKDRYYANVNVSRNNKVEVVYLNNISGNYEFLFTDSIESFIFVNFILDKIKYLNDDEAIPIDYFINQIKLIEKKVNFPEQFKPISQITGIQPSYRSYFPEAVYLFWRSLWIVHLLKSTSIDDVYKVRDIFNIIDRKSINKSEDQIKSVNDKTPAFKAIYWIWYFFFFKKEDVLNDYLKSTSVIPSPLVKDTVKLINDILEGRKEIGGIKDIHKLRDEFLKLNLDPDNKEKKVYRDVKNDMAIEDKLSIINKELKKEEKENNKDENKDKNIDIDNIENEQGLEGTVEIKSLGKYVNNIKKDNNNISSTDLDCEKKVKLFMENVKEKSIDKIIWDYIDNEEFICEFYESVIKREKSLQLEVLRYEYLVNEIDKKGNYTYNEVYETLMNSNSKLFPMLFVKGFYDFGTEYIKNKVLWYTINGKTDELEIFICKVGFDSYPNIFNEEFEKKLLKALPMVSEDEILTGNGVYEKFKQVMPILSRMKSNKLIDYIEKYINFYNQKLLNSKSNTKLYKMYYYQIGELFINCMVRLKDKSSIPLIKKYIDTPLETKAIFALLEYKDFDLIKILDKKNKKQFGVIEKRITNLFVLEYLKYFKDNNCDVSIIKKALRILTDSDEIIIEVFSKALEVLTLMLGKDSIDYLKIFIDSKYPKVREKTINLVNNLGYDENIFYLDKPYIDYVYKKIGKNELIKLLSKDFAVFKHNVMIKLIEEKESIKGSENDVINYLKKYFNFNLSNLSVDNNIIELIKISSSFNNQKIDDFIFEFIINSKILKNYVLGLKEDNNNISNYLYKKIFKYNEKNELKGENINVLKQNYGNKLWYADYAIEKITVNKNGKYCAVSSNNLVIIFNSDGEIKNEIKFDEKIVNIDFSKSNDKILINFFNGEVKILNIRKSDKVINLTKDSKVLEKIVDINYSIDGTQIGGIDDKGNIYIWNSLNFKLIKRINLNLKLGVFKWLNANQIVTLTDKTVNIIDLESESVKYNSNIKSNTVQVSSDISSKSIISLSDNKYIIILDDKLKEIKKLNFSGIKKTKFSPDKKNLYLISNKDGAYLVYYMNLDNYSISNMKDHEIFSASDIDMNPKTGIIYSGCVSGNIYCWTNNNQGISHVNIGHENRVTDMAYSKKYDCVISSSDDGTAIMWFANKSGLVLYNNEKNEMIKSVSVSKDERYIVYGLNGVIIKKDTLTGKSIEFETNGICSKLLPFSNNEFLAVVDNKLYFIGDDRIVEPKNKVDSIKVLNDKDIVITATKDSNRVSLYDSEDFNLISEFTLPHYVKGVISFELDEDEHNLYILCSDYTVRIFDTENWELEKEVFLENSYKFISVIGNAERVVVANEKELIVYDVVDFDLVAKTYFDENVTRIMKYNDNNVVVGFDSGNLKKLNIKK